MFLRLKPWPRWAELNEAVEQLMDFQITKVYFISIIIQHVVREKKKQRMTTGDCCCTDSTMTFQ